MEAVEAGAGWEPCSWGQGRLGRLMRGCRHGRVLDMAVERRGHVHSAVFHGFPAPPRRDHLDPQLSGWLGQAGAAWGWLAGNVTFLFSLGN